jgi:sirohydrochlorin ferrochelatase
MESKAESAFDTAADASSSGVLLVGHGTREAAGVAEFAEFARNVAARLAPLPVAPCFLELAEPGIAAGIETLAAQGVRRLVVVPVLLFAAAHAKHDIPEAVAAAVARRPKMTWRQAPHLGLDARVFELSARRLSEAIAAADAEQKVESGDTLLIVVGRGSRDPEALAEFEEFARRHASGVGYCHYRTAQMAMAEPPLPAALERAATEPFGRIVVQPHLLFGGVLVDRLQGEVADRRQSSPTKQWVATNHLGPDDLLVSALVEAVTVQLAGPGRQTPNTKHETPNTKH